MSKILDIITVVLTAIAAFLVSAIGILAIVAVFLIGTLGPAVIFITGIWYIMKMLIVTGVLHP